MIPYNPRCWYGLLFRYRGTVLPIILPRLAILGVWTVGILIAEQISRPVEPAEVTRFWGLNSLGHTLLGAVVGFLVVLRTNTAYDRFWEGRKLWGGIVNSSRNLIRAAGT